MLAALSCVEDIIFPCWPFCLLSSCVFYYQHFVNASFFFFFCGAHLLRDTRYAIMIPDCGAVALLGAGGVFTQRWGGGRGEGWESFGTVRRRLIKLGVLVVCSALFISCGGIITTTNCSLDATLASASCRFLPTTKTKTNINRIFVTFDPRLTSILSNRWPVDNFNFPQLINCTELVASSRAGGR